jgi:hypothetical protein
VIKVWWGGTVEYGTEVVGMLGLFFDPEDGSNIFLRNVGGL